MNFKRNIFILAMAASVLSPKLQAMGSRMYHELDSSSQNLSHLSVSEELLKEFKQAATHGYESSTSSSSKSEANVRPEEVVTLAQREAFKNEVDAFKQSLDTPVVKELEVPSAIPLSDSGAVALPPVTPPVAAAIEKVVRNPEFQEKQIGRRNSIEAHTLASDRAALQPKPQIQRTLSGETSKEVNQAFCNSLPALKEEALKRKQDAQSPQAPDMPRDAGSVASSVQGAQGEELRNLSQANSDAAPAVLADPVQSPRSAQLKGLLEEVAADDNSSVIPSAVKPPVQPRVTAVEEEVARKKIEEMLSNSDSRFKKMSSFVRLHKGKFALGAISAVATADLTYAYLKIRDSNDWKDANMCQRCIMLPCNTKSADLVRYIIRRIS